MAMPIAQTWGRSGLAWAALAGVLLVLAACADPVAGPGSQTGEPDAEVVGVVTAETTIRPLGVTIEAVGTARANESVEVTAKASNTVVAIHFHDGDVVRRGQVLVELDSAEARAALAVAQAALADLYGDRKSVV